MTKLSSLWVFTNFNESKECYIIQKYWHIYIWPDSIDFLQWKRAGIEETIYTSN